MTSSSSCGINIKRSALLTFLFLSSQNIASSWAFSLSHTPSRTAAKRQHSTTICYASSTNKKSEKGGGFASSSKTDITDDTEERKKSLASLEAWAKSAGIQSQNIKVTSGKSILGGGLGLLSTNDISSNSVLLQVPTYLAFTVSNSKLESNLNIESCFSKENDGRKVYANAPWWAKLSLELYYCDAISSLRSKTVGKQLSPDDTNDGDKVVDMRPWLNSLPRSFESPLHWTDEQRSELQYKPIELMVSAQEKSYMTIYNSLSNALSSDSPLLLGPKQKNWTYDDFVWGCECARSRAFSGSYGGSAFNPTPYALTLALVVAYIGLDLGSIEQAANGAALVFCGSVLRDFVLPKLFQSKRYVICPFIDMANHVGIREEGNVAFEYFADAYSLASKEGSGGSSGTSLSKGKEVRISYGPRSNDALLQNYGFVESGNVHDVYIMPPLREWDIGALEEACGRTFQPGRLEKLERAGLLGSNTLALADESEFEENVGNRGGGVIITRAGGFDPAIMTALRALVSTDDEWDASGQAVGNFVTENSGGEDNERVVRVVAQKALELELESKETTLEEDESLLKKGIVGPQFLAVSFRAEKKKLLQETIRTLKYK